MARFTTSLVTYVQDDSLGHVPASLKEELAKLASQRTPSGVLLHWYQLIKGQEITLPPAAYDNQALASYTHADVDKDLSTNEAAPTEPIYPCPWCAVELKLPKDFIRHVKQKCSATEVFRCPDCSKTFTRKQRFAKHHNTVHHLECGRGPCRHVKKATVALPQERTLACGFCKQLFHSDLHGYLRHLIGHYREGLTLVSWRAGAFVPVHHEHTDPSHIALDLEITDQSSHDFSALRSGFSLPGDFGRCESTTTSSKNPTTHEHDHSGKIAADNLVDSPYRQSEISLPNPNHSQYQNSSQAPNRQPNFQHREAITSTPTFFHGMRQHIMVHPSTSTMQSPWFRSSSTTTEACAELIAEREQSNSFDGNDYVLSYSDGVTLQPQRKDHRSSLSKRIFHALQSLPVLKV